ncbi:MULTISPECIES: hydroxymethylbilane synthase [unclassified Streptomyces]|uniref:hydroxymethylbilane synthase n=1 Tax=unclassified Streptomyces TaxID=2593676 RepID=UPI00081E72C6|nr:hydroxymethylbilane synthase [Streptomyces sp. LcepLS]MYR27444.1 hydroxymethylbilane synthase [Streptomyces sp. SID4945]SCF23831.1 hydroxymethylbilane synthase [Streptomyces sp. LcepLS]
MRESSGVVESVVTVGSRGSALARAQVREMVERWEREVPGVRFVRRVITEAGDADRSTPTVAGVTRRAGASAFSSRQEAALVRGEVDVVVHCLKDLPTAPAPGTVLLRTPGPREDVRDALCGATLAGLPTGARVGTGSTRRVAQLLALRPDLEVIPVRGNVPARLARTRTLDAVVLAAAGLHRLGLADEITEYLDPEAYPPAPGQGALAIQAREDSEAARLLAASGDAATDAEVRAERVLLAELHGGCSVPLGTWTSRPSPTLLRLHAAVTTPDGTHQIAATAQGPAEEPEKLALTVAGRLLAQGAARILATATA